MMVCQSWYDGRPSNSQRDGGCDAAGVLQAFTQSLKLRFDFKSKQENHTIVDVLFNPLRKTSHVTSFSFVSVTPEKQACDTT